MFVGWKMHTIITFIASGLVIPGVILALYFYFRYKYRPIIYLGLICFFSFVMIFTYALADFFLSIPILLICCYSYVPTGIGVVLLIDIISRESVDPIKLMVISLISGALVFVCLDPKSFTIDRYPNGEWGIFFSGYLLPILAVHELIMGTLMIYYFAKIHLNAPRKLKFNSFMCLVGTLILGVITTFVVILGLHLAIPGIHMALFGGGILVTTIFFASEPRLAYVLPFKVIRLAAIESIGGIPIYTYTWSEKEEMSDASLFSGMMHAINQFVQESLGKGIVREIHLEEAILILRKSEKPPVIFILVANKSSKTLRDALTSFAQRFLKDYSQFITQPIDEEKFKTASNLIYDCFPFVPEYD
ncbi:MAG: hypothetical protein ACFFCM_15610 [Promethearchaeota archaeon]